MSRNCHNDPASSCPNCGFGRFTRNHYFTGKLMLAGDFDAEQEYGVDKLRHHNQRLHGTGVVCGLKVVAHPNCPDRFICVERGTAIDCAGREIVIHDKDCVDFTQIPAVKKLIDQSDGNGHILQVCVRYRECPTDEVPVLYDDSGCNDTRCAPNRILESYEIDVIVDPKDIVADMHSPAFDWHCTVSPGQARRVAFFNGSSSFLYAISADQNTVFQIETDHYTIVGTGKLPAPGLEIAISDDGKRVYVVTGAAAAGANGNLVVLDTTKPFLPVVATTTLDIGTSGQGDVFLAIGADARLIVLLGPPGQLLIYPTTLDTATTSVTPDATIPLGTNLHGLALNKARTLAYTADTTGNRILVQDLKVPAGATAPSGTPIPLPAAITSPTGLALVASTGPDVLVVISNTTLGLIDPSNSSAALVGASIAPTNPPAGLVISLGGQWVYVLEKDTAGKFFVEAIELTRLQMKLSTLPGASFPVGAASQQIVISPSGKSLYIPFEDDPTAKKPGGIAVIEVSEADCDDIIFRSIDGCPCCCEPNCVVLATIRGFKPGDTIRDQTDPPSDAATDIAARIDRIDNRLGRRLLPSVQSLYELVECLESHASGGTGTQGPPGPGGPQGIQGIQGIQGPAAPLLKLPHICAINWEHAGTVDILVLRKQGLLIGFDAPVLSNGINEDTFIVTRRNPKANDDKTICFCEVPGKVSAALIKSDSGNQTPSCNDAIVGASAAGLEATGARFQTELWTPGRYRVVLKGDFILGKDPITLSDGRKVNPALDADHMGPGIPKRCPTGDGVEGGTFESWFTVSNPQ